MSDDTPHFFSGISFNFLQDIDYPSLVLMCQTAKKLGKVEEFGYLCDAFRMYQFAKISAQSAIELEKSMIETHEHKNTLEISMNPVRLSKNVCDFITYVKSTLDRIALFYNSYFSLGHKEQTCDFKWKVKFQQPLLAVVPQLTDYLSEFENWLAKDSSSTLSIYPLRDKWIHESYPIATIVLPIDSKLGLFPIAKDLNHAGGVTIASHMSLDYFFSFHDNALTTLLNKTLILIRDIQLGTVGSIEIEDRHMENRISFTHLIYIREGFVAGNVKVDPNY